MATTRYVFGKSRSFEVPAEAPAKTEAPSRISAGIVLFVIWVAIIAAVVFGGLVALFLR